MVSPFAYLLFYARRDVQAAAIEQLYPPDLNRPLVDLSKVGKKSGWTEGVGARCAVM